MLAGRSMASESLGAAQLNSASHDFSREALDKTASFGMTLVMTITYYKVRRRPCDCCKHHGPTAFLGLGPRCVAGIRAASGNP